jgi:hypothetical protein
MINPEGIEPSKYARINVAIISTISFSPSFNVQFFYFTMDL